MDAISMAAFEGVKSLEADIVWNQELYVPEGILSY